MLDTDTEEIDGEEEMSEQEMEAQESLRRNVLLALAEELTKSRDEAVTYRRSSGIERQWAEDERAHREGTEVGPGGDNVTDYANGTGRQQINDEKAKNTRSAVVVNIIRGRTSVAEARFSDIQLPTDDRNWGCSITPDPELDDQREDNRPAMQNGQQVIDNAGNPATMAAVAVDKYTKARKAMALMEVEIDDQLSECDYNAQQRKLIKQAAILGTGIIKGPNVVKSLKKKWDVEKDETGQIIYNDKGEVSYVLTIKEEQKPASRWVDCWNVYPSPGTTSDIQKSCEYIWEKDTILPRDVKKLIGVKGYLEDQLVAVLIESPKRDSFAITGRDGEKATKEEQGKAYDLWEGYLDLDREHLGILGVDCECAASTSKTVSCCVVLINDRPVKVELNVLDTEDIPYDFFRWEDQNINSPWGIGIPRMLTWLQRIMKAAWRAMMDNSGDSAKATIVASKELEPQGGLWALGKVFIAREQMEDARKAFAVFEVRNNQPHYQAIIEMVLRFADLETALPTIFQGEAQKNPDTLGQTNIAVDSANVGIRHRTKAYDDNITDKHITRYYHWNMQYNKNNKIKGDFDVISRGTSVLLERDQTGRAILEMYALKADPTFERIIDWDKAAEAAVKARKLDILKDDQALKAYDEQKKQNPPKPPQNPALEVASVRTQGDLQKEQIRQQSDMAELQQKAQEAENQRQHEREMKQLEYNMKLMEFAEKRNLDVSKLKVQLALNANSKQPAPQVATPPVEPAGRAARGQAYAQ